jgi:hypothetical protein
MESAGYRYNKPDHVEIHRRVFIHEHTNLSSISQYNRYNSHSPSPNPKPLNMPAPLAPIIITLIIRLPILLSNLPKRRGPSRPMSIKVLIEPRPHYTASGPQAADLDAVAAPSLLSAVTRQ